MKLNFINNRHYKAETEETKGGFTPEEKSELQAALGDVQKALETKQKSLVEDALKEHRETINESIKKFNDILTKKDETDQKNQVALDEVLVKFKDMQTHSSSGRVEAKSLQAAIIEALQDEENLQKLANVAKGQRAKIMLKGPIDLSMAPREYYDGTVQHKMENGLIQRKTVGEMTGATHLTGSGFVDQNNRQILLPAQKVNARDLVPTVRSETGTYVTYRETGGEGSISRQTTHGALKSKIDFDFAEVRVVTEYIAGIAQFAKQLMRQLPFLRNTLPRLLLREFYKVENRRFWDVVATANAAGGTASGSTETDDIKQIIDAVAALYDADYVASFGLLRYKALARINKYLLTNGNYLGSGGVMGRPDGSITVMGTPIYPVTWIPSFDKFLTFDNDYIERIEVESLALEFFEQDDVNVQKNLITARIECLEDFTVLQPAATLIEDLGNSASS